jgi:predicted ThiF/HesA family dinucleotide-utilizing enzyme
MKKLIIAFALIRGLSTLMTNQVFAQEVSVEMVDLKTQEKVITAQQKLEKKEEKLTKATESFRRDLDKFEKLNSKGKLSPNDVSIMTKKLDKKAKQLKKLKEDIADLHKFINESY